MINIRKITLTGILTALYFVLSLTLKIPATGNISLDLGYIALTVAAVLLGPIPGAIVGGLGAAIESILLSPYGLSIGWVVMNIIIGLIVGAIVDNDTDIFIEVCTIACAVFLGVCAKMAIECSLYSIPLLVKLPKSLWAFIFDAFVMIFAGVPLVQVLKGKVKIPS